MKLDKTTLFAAASAIAILAAAPVAAADSTNSADTKAEMKADTPAGANANGRMDSRANTSANAGIKADNLLDMELRNTNGDEVGDIESVIIDENGKVAAIVVGVGGFLGLGQRDVAIDWKDLDIDSERRVITTQMSKAQLEALPKYEFEKPEYRDRAFMDRRYVGDTRNDRAETERDASQRAGEAEKDVSEAARDARQEISETAREAERETSEMASEAKKDARKSAAEAEQEVDQMRADAQWKTASKYEITALDGAEVIDASGETIGEVDEVVRIDGKDHLVLSIGEFLGMGGHQATLALDKATVLQRGDEVDDLRVKVSMSKADLKALPKYQPKQ